MYIIIITLLIFAGVGLFILFDLHRAGVRSFRQFDLKRYWNTNQMRIIGLLIGAGLLTAIIWLMKAYIDQVVAQAIAVFSGLASGVASKNINKNSMVKGRPSLKSVAMPEIGQREIKGEKHNKRILQYATDQGWQMQGDEEAWCSTFVNWVCWRSGRTGSGSKMAKSWLQWGVAATEADIPSGNVIAVFHRGKAGASTGHVGIVDSFDGRTFMLLGGNQSDSVSIAPFPKDSKFLALRKPAE
jgi:uncharacterized protein (TIGR02594 family)